MGIVAQRYELVLFGNHQRLELQPWQPERRGPKGRVPLAEDTWYVMKLEVQNLDKGRVRARGKVWPKGEPEPAAWTIERIDPIGNLKGSARHLRRRSIDSKPAGPRSNYDNIKVYRTRNR